MFADSVMQYYGEIEAPKNLPADVRVMNPYQNPETYSIAAKFYRKYYDDTNPRRLCFGINPGRFGAGVTGVPFTDPIRLQEVCGVPHKFDLRAELSSKFIYEMIEAYGGANKFYRQFFITAVSPLGFIKNGINLNYYDIKGHKTLFEKYVVREIKKQLEFGTLTDVAFSIGKGENIKFLQWINEKYRFFEKVVPLSHPRWVMQYRLKRKTEFIEEYLRTFSTYC